MKVVAHIEDGEIKDSRVVTAEARFVANHPTHRDIDTVIVDESGPRSGGREAVDTRGAPLNANGEPGEEEKGFFGGIADSRVGRETAL